MTGAIPATVTIRSLTMGFGTGYTIDEAGISGLGSPPPKTAETSLDGQDGSFGGPEFLDVRAVSIPITIIGTDADDAMNGLAALNAAWAPANDGVDVELALADLPGWGDVSLFGRPRGVDANLTEVGEGIISALCQFVALQPAFVAP